MKDLEVMREFYIKYFSAVSNDGYYNSGTGFRSYFLTFEDGVRMELMRHPKAVEGKKTGYEFGYAHISFSVGEKEKVDSLTKRIGEDGHRVIGAPRTTGDGYYESVVCDPEGNYIEITN